MVVTPGWCIMAPPAAEPSCPGALMPLAPVTQHLLGGRPGCVDTLAATQLAVRCLAIYRAKYLGFPVLATEGTMATEYNVRVGDADREAVAAQLREHFADGRLTLEELNERLDQAFAAKTKADLNTVMRDLPQATRPGADMPSGGTAWRGAASQGPPAPPPGRDA